MFLDPSEFTFTSSLEANWQQVRDEFEALPHNAFDPWVQQSMHGEGWSIYGLFVNGNRVERACRNCPRTAELVGKIDGVSLAGFSRLAPKTHIKPHEGWAKSVYRLHLGLVVPPGCRFRVGVETRSWHEGKCMVFDDTVEHEAWNCSDRVRGVLLLDFLRPGVTDFTADSVPEEVRRYAEKLIS